MSSPHQRDIELDHLHPSFREAVQVVLTTLNNDGHPFRIFEAYRTPQRQLFLYRQGRTAPGSIVTKASPWYSYHQFGLAADFVLFQGGSWSWDSKGKLSRHWEALHRVGRANGLEPLSWELPHLQMANLDINMLRAGNYPDAGDINWAENLEGAIASWSDNASAPPPPELAPKRPGGRSAQEPPEGSPLALLVLPEPKAEGWHAIFQGREWKSDGNGVYLRDYDGGRRPIRSVGQPITARAVWNKFSVQIDAASRRFGVPPELLIMVIATESGAHLANDFTGPNTFRWESHVWNKDVNPPLQGDYSAGPMQTLATTARWVVEAQTLPFHKFQVAPVFSTRPVPPPKNHPLYDAATNIEIGTAEIKQRWVKTGSDPVLVAAAFNSGGLYESDANPWRLKTYGDHLDRAVKWYGDACAVLREAGVR